MAEGERRSAVRVSVRGFAVLHVQDGPGPVHCSLENLSERGALLHLANRPLASADPGHRLDLELRLPDGDGWVSAHAVRIARIGPRAGWQMAVTFDQLDATTLTAIRSSIAHARSAAHRRPTLVLDGDLVRRASLLERLQRGGLTPFAPGTPLEAIELLIRPQLQISVCLLGASDFAPLLADSFPWVTIAPITDDLEATTVRAIEAWDATGAASMTGEVG